MGRYERALPLYQRALRILLTHNQSPLELAMVEGNMASLNGKLRQPEQAIYFGKQSVNGFQSLRAGMTRLDKELQQGFLKQHEGSYTQLAGWLIDAGRLAEAQQVTAMLKEQELFELVRGGAETDPRSSRAGLTGFEARQQQQQRDVVEPLAAVTRGLNELEKKARTEPLNAEERRRRDAFEQQLAAGQAAFERYLSGLQTAFAQITDEQRRDIERLNITQARALQDTLETLGHGAVLLHYVVLDDQLKIILTTGSLQRGYSVPVDRKTLNHAIQKLREGIEDRSDVRAQARQLHDWLIAPVETDLRAAGAKTLMVALTDALRYLPFAALHDGDQWLAQRYAVALYTEAARQNMLRARVDRWQMQAFGLTRPVDGFQQLSAVRGELDAIVGARGLPGRARFDEEFTAQSFRDAIQERPPVLHIASHFVFRPGSESDSFLVMGDGSRMSLTDIKSLRFRQVDLLTLSACNTALGGGRNENGREIEGFGALAQAQGAGAVLATLWPVADRSTAPFMQRFYMARQAGRGMSKIEALQQAQLALIEGSGAADQAQNDKTAGSSRPSSRASSANAATVDPAHPYSHPYYWAAFVLMGNWL